MHDFGPGYRRRPALHAPLAERRNALGRRASTKLNALLDVFEADRSVRAAILTGEGDRAFCAGDDLGDGDRAAVLPATGFGGLTRRFDMTKPIVATVNGIVGILSNALRPTAGAESLRYALLIIMVTICGPRGISLRCTGSSGLCGRPPAL